MNEKEQKFVDELLVLLEKHDLKVFEKDVSSDFNGGYRTDYWFGVAEKDNSVNVNMEEISSAIDDKKWEKISTPNAAIIKEGVCSKGGVNYKPKSPPPPPPKGQNPQSMYWVPNNTNKQ